MTHINTYELTQVLLEAKEMRRLERKLEQYETFGTNNSLMVYTSGTNRTNIENLRSGETIVEDRTMSDTKTQLKEVRKEIHALEDELETVAERHGSVVLTAYLDGSQGAPKVTAPFLSDAWEREMQIQDTHFENIGKGRVAKGVVVDINKLSGSVVHLDHDLAYKIEAFRSKVQRDYAIKLRDLYAKRHALYKKEEAEQTIEMMNRKGDDGCDMCMKSCF